MPATAHSLHETVEGPAGRSIRGSLDDGLEARLLAVIGPVMRHLLALVKRRRSWKDMTFQQYDVLRMIDMEGPRPASEIARRLLVTAPVVTRLATTLTEAGLLERRPHPLDKRSVRLALTPAGRRRLRAMRRDFLAVARELLEPLPADRRTAVAAALEELRFLLPDHSASRR